MDKPVDKPVGSQDSQEVWGRRGVVMAAAPSVDADGELEHADGVDTDGGGEVR